MLLTRRRDARIFALRPRVILPHQPLQLGKFAHHVGQQIRLGEPCRPRGLLHVRTDQRRKLRREPLDALDALGLRAELLVEHDVLEFRQPVLEPRLQVGLVEELRVGEARPDDALVAGDDSGAAVRRLDVRDQDELVGERACFPPPSGPPGRGRG